MMWFSSLAQDFEHDDVIVSRDFSEQDGTGYLGIVTKSRTHVEGYVCFDATYRPSDDCDRDGRWRQNKAAYTSGKCRKLSPEEANQWLVKFTTALLLGQVKEI